MEGPVNHSSHVVTEAACNLDRQMFAILAANRSGALVMVSPPLSWVEAVSWINQAVPPHLRDVVAIGTVRCKLINLAVWPKAGLMCVQQAIENVGEKVGEAGREPVVGSQGPGAGSQESEVADQVAVPLANPAEQPGEESLPSWQDLVGAGVMYGGDGQVVVDSAPQANMLCAQVINPDYGSVVNASALTEVCEDSGALARENHPGLWQQFQRGYRAGIRLRSWLLDRFVGCVLGLVGAILLLGLLACGAVNWRETPWGEEGE